MRPSDAVLAYPPPRRCAKALSNSAIGGPSTKLPLLRHAVMMLSVEGATLTPYRQIAVTMRVRLPDLSTERGATLQRMKSGQLLGQYRIEGQLGQGGMGV